MNKIKVYLQKPWKKSDSPYYLSLKKFSPKNIKYENISEFSLIQKNSSLKLNNFVKQTLKKLIKNLLPNIPNAHKSSSGDYDLIHAAHCLSKSKKPWICDIEYFGQLWAAGGRKSKKAKKKVLKYLESPYCKKVLPWTKWTREQILNEFPQIKDKVELLYPGVHAQKFKKIKTGKTILLYSSRRFYFKGGFYAIEVMDRVTKKNKDVEGWIVSEVPKEVYEKYQSNKQIKFIGMVSQEKLFKEIYPAADIFLYPSFTDTFGFGIIEAMSFGLPVVTTEGHSRSEIVEDEKTGFVIKTGLGDHVPNSFLENLKREDILKNLEERTEKLITNKELCEKMGKNARKEVKEGKFSIKKRNEKLKRIYLEALKNEGIL